MDSLFARPGGLLKFFHQHFKDAVEYSLLGTVIFYGPYFVPSRCFFALSNYTSQVSILSSVFLFCLGGYMSCFCLHHVPMMFFLHFNRIPVTLPDMFATPTSLHNTGMSFCRGSVNCHRSDGKIYHFCESSKSVIIYIFIHSRPSGSNDTMQVTRKGSIRNRQLNRQRIPEYNHTVRGTAFSSASRPVCR